MDKPRHPLVTRPWKIRADPTNQLQPTADQNRKRAPRCRFDSKPPKILYSKKTREQGSKKTV
jgi:hypothetical protein